MSLYRRKHIAHLTWQAPLLRVHLFECLNDQHILLFTIHHIITDLHSLLLLFQELSDIYQSVTTHTPSSLPAVEFMYADFVAWQMAMLAGQRGQEHWHYWERQLADRLPVLMLPADRARPSLPTGQRASQSFVLQANLTQRLRGLARKEGVTLYTTLLTAFYIFLYRYTGQHDILVGS